MFLSHIWLIPLLPAFGAVLMFFFGSKLQKATVSAVDADKLWSERFAGGPERE